MLAILQSMDRSEQEWSSLFGNLSRNLEAVNSFIRRGSDADQSPSNSFVGARDALRSLRSSDTTLSSDMSSSFRRPREASNPQSSTSSRSATLPSLARGRGSSHNWSSRRQSTFPYSRRSNSRKPRNPRRYDMNLMVIDSIPELISKGSIANYNGETVIETPFFLMEDQTAEDVNAQILHIIQKQFPDYDSQFFFASRRNKNRLSIAVNQELDARGVHTLKGSGCVCIVVLENSVVDSEDEVSGFFLFLHYIIYFSRILVLKHFGYLTIRGLH